MGALEIKLEEIEIWSFVCQGRLQPGDDNRKGDIWKKHNLTLKAFSAARLALYISSWCCNSQSSNEGVFLAVQDS